ncbi:26S proteasome non-ATPase regulatory subunit 10-like [Achroia grisella]|uniref:26S proteasome non-ATPase regulatory subunit 10-like n=1 Tax=Achroia grisella TaxID=688607 RepID=UPI0027D2A4A0|nr:26S proteasome non-ATPase regulatory subunit 10-like [Achroia grisella]
MSIGSVFEMAYKGDFNQVKVKLDQDIQIACNRDSNGRQLLHWAALSGNVHLVEYLIGHGNSVNSVDDTGSTPLILAASAGKNEVVLLLIGKGADVDHKTNRGQSALHYACSKGHYSVVKLLVQNDANVNNTDVLKATALHRAAAQGRNNIIELLLLSPDVKLDLCDSTGCTPLHLACEEDREAVACMLVKAGADLHIKNKEQKSPLDLSSLKLQKCLTRLVDEEIS